jgi:hypothetical protein
MRPEQPSDDGAQELARRTPAVVERGRHLALEERRNRSGDVQAEIHPRRIGPLAALQDVAKTVARVEGIAAAATRCTILTVAGLEEIPSRAPHQSVGPFPPTHLAALLTGRERVAATSSREATPQVPAVKDISSEPAPEYRGALRAQGERVVTFLPVEGKRDRVLEDEGRGVSTVVKTNVGSLNPKRERTDTMDFMVADLSTARTRRDHSSGIDDIRACSFADLDNIGLAGRRPIDEDTITRANESGGCESARRQDRENHHREHQRFQHADLPSAATLTRGSLVMGLVLRLPRPAHKSLRDH